MAKLAASGNNSSARGGGSSTMSPSNYAGSVSGTTYSESPYEGSSVGGAGGYEAPQPIPSGSGGVHA